MNVGFKAEYAGIIKSKSDSADILSFLVAFDYYFHSTGKRYSPFIGAGLGYFFCEARSASYIQSERYSKYNNPSCLIRVGYEIRKCRMSLTYNLIRKPTEIYWDNKNYDYMSLNIGFYLGGGKWE